MTATATKVPTLKMTVNVPIDIDLKYIDVWPNDPDKDPNGKGYGASVAFKGTVSGEEYRIYPKGFVNKTIEKLVNAGVIEDGHYQHDPAEKYSIPVKQGILRIVNSQPAGERYANFDIQLVNGQPVQAPAKINPRKAPVPAHANVPEADLPPLLQNAEAEDNAALAAKVGPPAVRVFVGKETGEKYIAWGEKIPEKLALYQALTEWYLANIPQIYEKAKIGCSPESAAAGIHTLFITANK